MDRPKNLVLERNGYDLYDWRQEWKHSDVGLGNPRLRMRVIVFSIPAGTYDAVTHFARSKKSNLYFGLTRF